MSKRAVALSDDGPIPERPYKVSKQDQADAKVDGTITLTNGTHDDNATNQSAQAGDEDQSQQLAQIENFLAWIKDLGADLSSLKFAPSPHGGVGAFATTKIQAEGIIGRIPNEAVMSVGRSAKSVVGKAVAATDFDEKKEPSSSSTDEDIRNPDEIPCRPTKEFVLWLDMCHGRRNKDHPHHPYLASLPANPPDVPSWPDADRLELEGTTLGVAADKAANTVRAQYEKWMPQLQKAHPKLFGKETTANEKDYVTSFGHRDIMWASGMYFSRRFPTVLLQEGDKSEHDVRNESETPDAKEHVGIMLPVFDLLNHNPEQQITWSGSPTHVSFTSGPSGDILPGSEVYNNYGPKSNEQLMFMYGFALPDNVHDSFGLGLVLGRGQTMEGDGEEEGAASVDISERKDLGTFQIHRWDSPKDPQFPPGLWRALSELFEEEEEEGDEQSGSNNAGEATPSGDVGNEIAETGAERKDPGKSGNEGGTDPTTEDDNISNEEEEGEKPVEVGVEAVEFLLETLQGRLKPFLATEEKDSKCETDIARYRNGQRVVLEMAIETLEEMIPEEEGDEEGVDV